MPLANKDISGWGAVGGTRFQYYGAPLSVGFLSRDTMIVPVVWPLWANVELEPAVSLRSKVILLSGVLN